MKISLRSLMALKAKVWVIVLVAVLFCIIGFTVGSLRDNSGHGGHEQGDNDIAQTWTCSMHPQIRQPEPGKCPSCGMDLIPIITDGDSEEGERLMTMSPAAMKLAEITTSPAERKFVDVEIPLVGKVDYDETRVKTISAWVAGRLDRLFVDYTGVPVKEGDHLVEIYSPELYSAQEELLQAVKAARDAQNDGSEYIKKSSADTLDAVREKLTLLGLETEQITNIELGPFQSVGFDVFGEHGLGDVEQDDQVSAFAFDVLRLWSRESLDLCPALTDAGPQGVATTQGR